MDHASQIVSTFSSRAPFENTIEWLQLRLFGGEVVRKRTIS
jgi:hypothetical protein